MPKVDLGTTSPKQSEERGMRWVEVPEKDIFELPFDTIRVNYDDYPPGKHYVTADRADWIENRIRAKQKLDLRTMQRNPDLITQDIMTRNGSARSGGFVKNPDEVMKD